MSDSASTNESSTTPEPSNEVTPGETSAEPAEAAGGDEGDSDDSDAGEGDGAPAGEGESAPEVGASAASDAPKKKRKRRRKKKPGAQAAEGGPEGEGPGGERRDRGRPSTDRAPFHVGEEVFGKVTSVLDAAVMVDLSGKALAVFDRGEMEADDLLPSVGDRFVARVHQDGVRGGLVVLTRKPLREEEAKPRIEAAAKSGDKVMGLVTGVIRGGVEVDIDGVRAFAPASGMDLHPGNANFAALLGQRLDFKVIEFKNGGRDVVVTRRAALEQEAHERRKHALGLLTAGSTMKGVVRTVVEWGAFVALPEAENLEGLVHVSEASHDPRARMDELFKPGDEIEVQITKIDERGKIWLSRKALVEDPWAEARSKYAPGTRHTGKVTRTERFGAFVELEPGLDGLLHLADLTFDRTIEHANQLLKDGQDLDVVVHHFDARQKRLSLHAAPPAGRDEPPQRIAKYSGVKVEVVKAEPGGVIVRILGVTGRTARGFIPAGQTSTQRGTDLRKHFKAGTILDAKIIDIDDRRGEPKLSIKGFAEDEEKRAHKEYRQKLKAEGGFGTLGDLLSRKLKG